MHPPTQSSPQKNSFVSPHSLLIYLKGMAMGGADIVPGISGGTIAFITGIYQTLITTLANILSIQRIRELLAFNIRSLYHNLNLPFLLPLGLGIFTSILLLAHGIEYLLNHYPVLVWSFFFALILSSSLIIFKKTFVFSLRTLVVLVLGAATAAIVMILIPLPTVTTSQPSLIKLFTSGMIAITAMLLPGISGSYLLLILGDYATIINAIKTFNFPILITFALGCGLGVVSCAHFLRFILTHYTDMTMAFLIGFMLGALPRSWPWRTSSGTLLLPQQYNADIGPAYLLASLLIMLSAAALIFFMDQWSQKPFLAPATSKKS